jgi:ubiquinone/menaquinone biosynthesis C-methylase UbiE
MFPINFTQTPDSYDEYGVPTFEFTQTKGLRHNQNNVLLEIADNSYLSLIDEHLFQWVNTEILKASNGKKLDVLEVGGGNGCFYERVDKVTSNYYNIEPGTFEYSKSTLERIDNDNYACIKCSAENIPLSDATVDIVISIASLDHVPDYVSTIKEARRLLRKDGRFILCFNNKRSWWKILLKNTNHLKKREAIILNEHYFQWSFEEAVDMLSTHFENVQAETRVFIPFIPFIWKVLFPIAELLGPKLLKPFGGNICLVCKNNTVSDAISAQTM